MRGSSTSGRSLPTRSPLKPGGAVSSPLRERAVPVPPERAAPPVPALSRVSARPFVDFDTEARLSWPFAVAVLEIEHGGVDEVIKQIALPVVVDAGALFLY